MSAIVFLMNDKIIGVFNDKKEFKTKSFHYILDIMISKDYFRTKKQCGVKIKDDLKLLYEENDYAFIYNDLKFNKMLFDYNEIEKVVKKQTENIFIVYTLKDLKSPLEMLDVSGYYNKNE